jgi:hypothetical protein
VNNELERIGEDVVIGQCQILSQNLARETDENHEKF